MKFLKLLPLWLLIFTLGGVLVTTQTVKTHITTGGTLPANCSTGDFWVKTGSSAGPYWCSATNTWTGPLAAGGTVTNTGTLTSGALIQGNGGTDVTANTSTLAVTKLTSGAPSAASAGTDYVAPGAVTTSGLTQATGKLLGRTTASTGAIEEITVGSGLTFSGGSLSASGVGGSGLVLLEEHTAASSTDLVFNSWYSSSYDDYKLEFVSVIAGTNNSTLELLYSSDGGGTYDTSNNYKQAFIFVGDSATLQGNTGFQTFFPLAYNLTDNSSHQPYNASFTMYDPANTSGYKTVSGLEVYGHNSAGQIEVLSTVTYTTGGFPAINAFKVLMSSGTFSGTVRVYGMTK